MNTSGINYSNEKIVINFRHYLEILLILIMLSAFSYATLTTYASSTLKLDSLRISGTENRAYSNQNIVIKGDISVDENASLSFQNCNLTILWILRSERPHIGISDNGSLLLENSTLMLRLDQIPNYSTNGRIVVRNNGMLVVHGSSIQSTDDVMMWFLDEGRGSFINAAYSGKAPKSNLHWVLEDMLPEKILREYFDDFSLFCEGFTDLEINNSSVGGLNIYENTTCSVVDSRISRLNPNSARETFVQGSEITILLASQRDKEFRFTGSTGGFYSEWRANEFFGPETSTNVRLSDTSFDHLWLSLVNCTSVIEDADLWLVEMYQGELSMKGSNVWVMRASYGNATIQDSKLSYLVANREEGDLLVDGCDVGWLGLTALSRETQYHKVQATIQNTEIGSCAVNYWTIPFEVDVTFRNVIFENLSMRPALIFEARFDNCKVKDVVTLHDMSSPEYSLRVTGSIDMVEASLIGFPNTVLTREYEVQVIEDNIPVEGIEVQVLREGKIWKNGATDSDGKYFFEATWINNTISENRWVPLDNPINNMTSSLVIQLNDYKINQQVSILSLSPILLDIQPKQDYRLTFAIVLIVLFAVILFFIYRAIRPGAQ